MKKYLLLLTSAVTMGTAGGDIAPVETAAVPVAEFNGWYAGGGFNYNRTYADDSKWFDITETQDNTFGLTGIVGYNFNDYLAVEGRIAASIFEQDYADVLSYGIYLKPQYPVTDIFSVYALLGVAKTRVKGTDDGGTEFGIYPRENGQTLIDETAFSWGVGVQYDWSKRWSLMFDYVSWADDATMNPPRFLYNYNASPDGEYDKLSNDSLTLSIIYKF